MSNKGSNIVFIGHQGAGKTTLLASMMTMLSRNDSKFRPLTLRAKGDTFKLLNKRWSDFLDALEKSDDIINLPDAPIVGTKGIVKHEFTFSNGKQKVDFNFVDTAGGLSEDGEDSVAKSIEEACAVICVIDAVRLMEKSEEKARNDCAVEGIKKILETVLSGSSGIKEMNCLFVMTKCETYMHACSLRKKNAKTMGKRFFNCFKEILDLPGLTSYYLPVETLGCVEFSRFDAEGKPVFRRKREFSGEKLTNIYQPLCFVMSELFEKLKKRRSWWTRLIETLDVFRLFEDKDFADYAEKLRNASSGVTNLLVYAKDTQSLEKQTGFEFK